MFHQENTEAIETFWRKYLAGISLPLIFGKCITVATSETQHASEKHLLTEEQSNRSSLLDCEETYAKIEATFGELLSTEMMQIDDMSVEHFLFGCLLVLMYRYTSETDFTLGFSHNHSNVLPVRTLLDTDNLAFHQIVTTAISNLNDLVKYPLSSRKIRSLLPDYIQSALYSTEDAFDISLHVNTVCSSGSKNIKPGLFAFEVTHGASGYTCTLHYAKSKFDPEIAESMLEQFHIIVRAALKNQASLPHDFELASEKDVRDVETYNDTNIDPVYKNMGVTDVLREVATQFPAQDAIVFQPENRDLSLPDRMSYRELDQRVSALAYYLRHVLKFTGKQRIGISLARSPDLFVAILAVMRAGLVVVTLGSNKDAKVRNIYRYKADQSNISLFLTDDETKELLAHKDKQQLLNISSAEFKTQLSDIRDRLYSDNADEKLTFVPPPFDPARTLYIMYTSGSSSGKPSGIKISHNGLMNLLNHHANKQTPKHKAEISIAKDDSDALLYQVVKSLGLWLTIVTTTNPLCMDVAFVASLMNKHDVYYADLLANFLRRLLEYDLKKLGVVISMGESSEANTFTHVNRNYPDTMINEGYGPTECTICASDDSVGNFGIPGVLGKPIANSKMFVLTGDGKNFALCPFYVPGEIVISGPLVGKGYLHKEQDEGKFIYLKRTSPQQFTTCEAHEFGAMRCYLTGDYGRSVRAPDGSVGIQFIGRKDEIIKINGVTVNPKGIASLLLSHPEIEKMVEELVIVPVRDKHNNNLITSLMGLVLMKEDYKTNITDEDLSLTLHECMESMPLQPIAIPRFMQVAQIPLSLSGKINSKELEAFAAGVLEDEEKDILHPSGGEDPDLITYLTKLIAGILGKREDEVCIADTFAQLGIDSKTITLIIGEVNRALELSKHRNLELRYGMGPENVKEENSNDAQNAAVNIEQLATLLAKRLAHIKGISQQGGMLDLNLRKSRTMQLRMLAFGHNIPQNEAAKINTSVEKSPHTQQFN